MGIGTSKYYGTNDGESLFEIAIFGIGPLRTIESYETFEQCLDQLETEFGGGKVGAIAR